MTFGRSKDAGKAGNGSVSLSMPSLPAEVTNSIPEFAMAFENGASCTFACARGTRRPYELFEMTTPNDLA